SHVILVPPRAFCFSSRNCCSDSLYHLSYSWASTVRGTQRQTVMMATPAAIRRSNTCMATPLSAQTLSETGCGARSFGGNRPPVDDDFARLQHDLCPLESKT